MRMKTKNYVDIMLSFICVYRLIFHRIVISSYLKRLFRLMIFYTENQQQYSRSSIGSMPHEQLINAELSLQSASQNSRQNIQGQSWSQIRKL